MKLDVQAQFAGVRAAQLFDVGERRPAVNLGLASAQPFEGGVDLGEQAMDLVRQSWGYGRTRRIPFRCSAVHDGSE